MSIYSNLNKDERHNVLLTIKIRESGTERHIGAIDKFKKFLIDGVSKRYYYLSSMGESKGEGICYLCNKRNELYGYVLPNLGFSFATADKPGFTPSLVQVDNWKNNPICKNCALLLERGMKFLNENLKYPKRNSNNYFRYEYYIIPKFTFTSGIEEIFGKLNKYIEHYQYEEYTDGLISKEDWVVNELMQENNILKMIFLFYTKKGGGKFIDIVNYIEDVIPSWIKLIFDLQKEIREHKIFQEEGMKNLFRKKWMGDFINGIRDNTLGLGKNNWFLVFLRNFFPQTKDHGTFDDQFLSILDSLLTNRKINRNLLINAFMREIRIQFKNKHSYSLKILAIKSLMLVSFLTKLGILENNNEIDNRNIELIIGGNSMEKIEELFEEFEIDDMTKRAAFIVGILVNYVLYIQRKERDVGYGEEPFWNKLYGLILDEAKIKNIFRESIAKLRQYKTSFLEIEELAAKYLASTEKNWKLNKDQVSYYFSLGMSLARALTVNKKEKNKK
jgi:CRISPR-associated protein Csh1